MLIVVYLIAITVEAMSGALAAGRRNMDIFGVAVIAFVTALGGGTIRDLIPRRRCPVPCCKWAGAVD
jgi:uncharacterized membrane protein YeiH